MQARNDTLATEEQEAPVEEVRSGVHRSQGSTAAPEIENVLGGWISQEVGRWCMWYDAACSVSTLGGLGARGLGMAS